MSLAFQKAVKTKVKARMAIDGPTGAGKTYTALVAATAFANGGKIAVIDTERGSASLYADIFEFDVLELDYYDPLKYVEAIKLAEQAGYSVLVIDSLSHAWEGEGGALDQVDQNAAKMRGNSYAAWRTVTPKHRKLVDTILQVNMHVITTMRSKMEYSMEKDNQGKSAIRKVGLAPVQRSGIEYEFTWVVDMDYDHNAVVSKSRAADLADLIKNKPDTHWFSQFYGWLVEGKEPEKTKKDLIEFGASIGLEPKDIAEALKSSGIEWNPSPEAWPEITNAVTEYAENMDGHEEEEVLV
jgi:hypothetical protein